MVKFESKDGKLFINGKEVLRGWESYTGWYWFGIEVSEERKIGSETGGSIINGQEVDDVIWYGFVQGTEPEFGYFSEAELKSMGGKVWEIPAENLHYSGRKEE